MRNASKLFLLAVVAGAMMAISASSAFAQNVELVSAEPSTHCGVVSEGLHSPSGGCIIAAEADAVDLVGHVFGIEQEEASDCHNDFTLHANEDGAGYVTGMDITGSAECEAITSCNSEAGETHSGTHGEAPGDHSWAGSVTENTSDAIENNLTGQLQVCFETDSPFIPECEGRLNFNITRTNENLYEARIASSIPAGAGTFATKCEVEQNGAPAHYDLTPVGEVHINHLQ